jgi:hypothetical protein
VVVCFRATALNGRGVHSSNQEDLCEHFAVIRVGRVLAAQVVKDAVTGIPIPSATSLEEGKNGAGM